MKNSQEMNTVSTLSNELLKNLDERVFFSKLSSHIHTMFGEYKVQVFAAYQNGVTELIAQDDEAIENGLVFQKGQGLSGYVVRTKRAYYSNSRRDPLLATSKRDDCVESELCVPLLSDGEIMATIHIQSSNEARKFNDEDIETVNSLISELSQPINNLRMYFIAKNLNKELENKIKEKEEELQNRGPSIGSRSDKKADVEMLGHAKAFFDVLTVAKKIASEDFPVLINGASGTGKKMLAKKIHSLSNRSDRECITVHCSAIEEDKLELELFGTTARPGVIQRANGGTVILNSVESLTSDVQRKLLRLIISGELYNTDSNIPMAVNVRIVSVTKSDLTQIVEEGGFSEELLYRLNIMNLKMPSLKERREDIKLLAENFLNSGTSEAGKMLTGKAIDKLTAYAWPGNIHELKNLMERTAILNSEQFIDEAHLPELHVEVEEEEEVVVEFSEMTLHALEKMHICKTLDHLGGNKTRAAKSLGITVKTLYNKLHSYGLVHPKSE